jgi:hypothetical protein
MKNFLVVVSICLAVTGISSCKKSRGSKSLCEKGCLKDTVKFTGDHPLAPYVYLLTKDCGADSIIWSYNGMGTSHKIKFDYPGVTLNSSYITCLFNDTAFAYLLFNDCATKRGYQLKLPFNNSDNISKRSSGINPLDPKFNIAPGLVAYTDRGNIYVEEIKTGKTAMMTFGQATDMDYDAIHETLDSVNVTPSRIWVKIKIEKRWNEMDKNITLQ